MKKNSLDYLIKAFQECAIAFLQPFIYIILYILRLSMGNPIELYIFIPLFLLSIIFAACTWGGMKEEEKQRQKNK